MKTPEKLKRDNTSYKQKTVNLVAKLIIHKFKISVFKEMI